MGCGPEWHSAELGRHVWTQWVLDHLGWLRAINLEYHDLQLAFRETSVTACVAALVQVLAALVLVFLHAVIFSFSPWQFCGVLVLVWAKGVHKRSGCKATHWGPIEHVGARSVHAGRGPAPGSPQ